MFVRPKVFVFVIWRHCNTSDDTMSINIREKNDVFAIFKQLSELLYYTHNNDNKNNKDNNNNNKNDNNSNCNDTNNTNYKNKNTVVIYRDIKK